MMIRSLCSAAGGAPEDTARWLPHVDQDVHADTSGRRRGKVSDRLLAEARDVGLSTGFAAIRPRWARCRRKDRPEHMERRDPRLYQPAMTTA